MAPAARAYSASHLYFPTVYVFGTHSLMPPNMLDLAIAVPTLVGSILSMIAAGFIFCCYLVLLKNTSGIP